MEGGNGIKTGREKIGMREKIETIHRMNKELNAKSARGGVRESCTVSGRGR